MTLTIAFQMDPIDAIDIDADSTFRIAEEAQARGHSLFYYTPDKLFYREGRVLARGWPLEVRREKGNHFTLGDEVEQDLAEVDVVWLRQDPPFDMGYITTTHLLDMIHPDTLVVNDPFWVRNYPEKLLVLEFPDLTPPTMIARDLDTLRAFKADHGDMILKPLYGNGGAGVFRLGPDDRNLTSLHELFSGINREPLIAQKFLPAVSAGDKRIILVDGEPVGAINRVPQAGENPVQHARRRAPRKGRADRTRPGNLRRYRPAPARKGADLRRHRRDRRLADRDQRDLAHRHSGVGAFRRCQHRRKDLAGHRSAAGMSWQLTLANAWMRVGVKPVLAHMHQVRLARALLDRVAPKLFRAPPLSLYRWEHLTPDLRALRISNRPGSHPPKPGKVMLYFHGGGFIAGSPLTHRHMLARLSRLTRVEVVAPRYRLAPEHPFPAAFEDACDAFDALMAQGYKPEDIILGGDSAGGSLALAVLARLTAEGCAPRALFAFSPLTDMSFSGESFRANAATDPCLPASRSGLLSDWVLAGADPTDPRISPLFAAFAAPPPVFLQFGDTEILRDDSRRMAAHLRAAGGEVTCDEWANCPHVWVLMDGLVPEAREALTRVAGFVNAQFG